MIRQSKNWLEQLEESRYLKTQAIWMKRIFTVTQAVSGANFNRNDRVRAGSLFPGWSDTAARSLDES
jgi:hypothetical protein